LYIPVTNNAFTITLLANTANGDTWLLAAKDQIWMMLCHFVEFVSFRESIGLYIALDY
jgi:hypothetical protein